MEKSDIIVESRSRNTHENALFTSQLIKRDHPNANCLLISSAWHLPRAEACFNKAGLFPTPFATDPFKQATTFNLNSTIMPDNSVLDKWNYLIKEWVGYLSYKLAGYL